MVPVAVQGASRRMASNGAGALPFQRVGDHDLGVERQPAEVARPGTRPAAASARAAVTSAPGRELGGLAAGGSTEVEDAPAADLAQQQGRQGGGGVLDPPARPRRSRAGPRPGRRRAGAACRWAGSRHPARRPSAPDRAAPTGRAAARPGAARRWRAPRPRRRRRPSCPTASAGCSGGRASWPSRSGLARRRRRLRSTALSIGISRRKPPAARRTVSATAACAGVVRNRSWAAPRRSRLVTLCDFGR